MAPATTTTASTATTWDLPSIDSKHSQRGNKNFYISGLKRAATVTVTGYRGPRPPTTPKMHRPVSMMLESEVAKHARMLSPPFFLEKDFRPRSRSLPKDDPFIADHSDSTESVHSSENDDAVQSEPRRESTHTEHSAFSLDMEEPVLTACLAEPFQQPLVPYPSPQTRPSSSAFQTSPTISLPSPEIKDTTFQPTNREFATRTPSPTFTTSKRVRPASASFISPPKSQESVDRIPRKPITQASTPPKTITTINTPPVVTPPLTTVPKPSRSQVRHVSSPAAITAKPDDRNPQTPTSLVRRLSRRLSVTFNDPAQPPRSRSPSKSNTIRTHTRPSSVSLSASNSTHNLPLSAVAPLPTAQQLASLDRRNIQMTTQIMRTPPQIRARSNTAPRAATGARRYGMFPQESDQFGLIEEDDAMIEEEEAAMAAASVSAVVPVPAETISVPATVANSLNGRTPAGESGTSTPTRQGKERQSGRKRLSSLGSRIGGSARQSQSHTPSERHGSPGGAGDSKCAIM